MDTSENQVEARKLAEGETAQVQTLGSTTKAPPVHTPTATNQSEGLGSTVRRIFSHSGKVGGTIWRRATRLPVAKNKTTMETSEGSEREELLERQKRKAGILVEGYRDDAL